MMEEMQSLADLLDLQDVDSQIDRLLHQRESLPELEQYRAAHDAAEEVAGRLRGAEEQLRELSLGLDKAEGELELLEQKLHQHEQRLFAGGLSAREAEHLRQEVESLRKRDSELEDGALELLERREEMDRAVGELRAELEQARAEEGRLESLVAAEWKTIDAELGRIESRKAEILPSIPSDLFALYERVRPQKEGVAVAPLSDGTCGGCHLALSAAEQEEVLAGDPPRCIHCMRILVP